MKILVLKGLKGCGNELQPQKNQSNYHISDTIQLEIKRIQLKTIDNSSGSIKTKMYN